MLSTTLSAPQGNYPAVTFNVVNLARSGIDVQPAATCWYQLAPQVRGVVVNPLTCCVLATLLLYGEWCLHACRATAKQQQQQHCRASALQHFCSMHAFEQMRGLLRTAAVALPMVCKLRHCNLPNSACVAQDDDLIQIYT
jgi:hypothetical protein